MGVWIEPMTNNLVTSEPVPENHSDKIADYVWEDFAEQFAKEASIGFRLQSCWPQDENEPMTFFGTENEPDPSLIDLSDINLLTDSQWLDWDKADKRQVLLQCPSVREAVIKNPGHEFCASYEYQATSLKVLCDELKSVISVLLNVK